MLYIHTQHVQPAELINMVDPVSVEFGVFRGLIFIKSIAGLVRVNIFNKYKKLNLLISLRPKTQKLFGRLTRNFVKLFD